LWHVKHGELLGANRPIASTGNVQPKAKQLEAKGGVQTMRETKSVNQDEARFERNEKGRIRIGLTLVLIAACSAFAFLSRAHNRPLSEPAARTAPHASQPAPSIVVQAKPRELVTTVRFDLFDMGILPREVHVRPGLLAITIEDYSGGTSGVVVERETGNAPEQVGRVERAGGHWRGRREIRLGPGRYQVRMADRPANRALLVVEP
ncbi:MAG: hypothetical protein AABO41_22920, partial [Acidobacteriota bacterium]